MKVKMIDLISSLFVGKSIMVYYYRYKDYPEKKFLELLDNNSAYSSMELVKTKVWLIDKVTIDSDWSGDTIFLHSGSNIIIANLGLNGGKEITFV